MHTVRSFLVFGAVMCAASGYSQVNRDGFVLVPLYTSFLPGAFGSSWTTNLTVRNDGPTPVVMTALRVSFPITVMSLPPGDWDLSATQATSYGEIIRMPSGQLEQLHFHVAFHDLSRQASSAGVELPIVRQSEIRSPVVLLSVPVASRFRSALRIYDVSGHENTVRLRIFALEQSQPLVDSDVTLPEPPIAADNDVPAQRDICDLTATYPALADATALRIEIEGASATLWAFVSTTNNDTQEVTLVTPQ